MEITPDYGAEEAKSAKPVRLGWADASRLTRKLAVHTGKAAWTFGDVVLSAHRATHRAVAQGRTADRVGKGAARGAQSTHGASGGVGGARQGYASETRKVSSGLQR